MASSALKSQKYNQLYTTFYNKIISGEWKNGQKILPERELCEKYGVSRITVRETLRLLSEQGIVHRKQGSGTFVTTEPTEQKLTKLYTLREHFDKTGIKSHAIILEYDNIKADLDLSQKLEIILGESVIRIKRVFLAADNPYTLETTFLPEKIFPLITKTLVDTKGLYKTISALGVSITSAVERLQPIMLNEIEARVLKEKTSSVAMRINRTTYSAEKVIEYTESIVPGNYFIYTVELS